MNTPYNSSNSINQHRSYGLTQDDFRQQIKTRYNDVLVDHDKLAQSEPGMLSDTWNAIAHGASSELAGLSRFLGFDGLTNYFQSASDNRLDNMSERGRAAFENELQFDLDESPLSHWWLNTASAIGQFGTSIAGGGVVGAGVRRGLMSAASRAGASQRATSAAGMGGLMAGHASVGGSAATGQTILEAEAAYDQLSQDEKLTSPAFLQKMDMLREIDPDLDGDTLFGLADAAIREQIARDIRTDPRILFANYGLSAVVDPVIGGTIGRTAGSRILNQLTRSEGAGAAARLGGAAVRTGAHFGKGATLGAPTEVIQDMELQRGVARSLEGIDPNADPNKIDTNRALVSGVLGGVAQGSIAAVTSRSPIDTSNIKDPDADAIRDTNPGLAEQLDTMAQSKARHEIEVSETIERSRQVAASVDSFEQPAILRRTEQTGPERPASARLPSDQRGDLEQPAYQRFANGDAPAQVRDRVRGNPEQPAYTRARNQTLEDSQLDADIRMLDEERQRQPREGELLPGASNQANVPAVDSREPSFNQSERNSIEVSATREELPDRSGMPMSDRRNEQAIREELERAPKAIIQSSTIFARDENSVSMPEDVTVRQNGAPFASERAALSSLRARQANERGDTIEAVEVAGGWGWRASTPNTDAVQAQTETQPTPSQEGVLVSDEASTSTNESASRSSAQIDDFGEKIGGARKDIWSGLREAVDSTDTKSQPLSKSFPQPDYAKLKEAGADSQVLAAVAALRQSIPNKPRTRGVSRWAETADSVRRLAAQLLDGTVKPERLIEYARQQPGLRSIANAIPVIAEADPSVIKQAAEFTISESSGLYVDGKPFGNGFIVERNGRGDWNRITRTLDEAQAVLRKKIKALKNDSQAQSNKGGSNFSLFRDRSTGGTYIGWKGASKVLRVEDVESINDGRARINNNRDELETKLEQLKATPSARREQNSDRVGQVRAEGDVTAEQFSEAFGFRGVEFGNWVEQGKRQADLNNAFESLHDLAEALGVPPQSLSLNGELALAFGARGKGGSRAAAAHYEPGRVVINLTKRDGAGSLAHEWFHALDNYFSRERGLPGDYLTQRPYSHANDPTRKEVVKAFKGVTDAIKKSGMVARSNELDSRRSKRYWSTDVELSARAFEAYIISKLGKGNATNDYLANIVEESAWNVLDDGTYPYPTAAELKPINEAFDNLFDTIETRKTDKGIKFFSKNNVTDKAPKKGVAVADIQSLADTLLSELAGASGIKVKVFETQQQAERAWKMSLDGALVKGAFDEKTNTAYVVAENITNLDEARQTLAHEVIAHGGLQNVIGESEYQDFLNRLKSTRGKKTFEKQWQEIDRDYDGMSEDVKAEELFAKFVETQPDAGAMRHWFSSIRNWLRRALANVGLIKLDADAEVMRSMMESIVDGFKVGHATMAKGSGNPVTADLAFSKTTDTRTAEEKIGQGIIDDTLSSKFKETVAAIKTKGFWHRVREGLFDGLHGIKQAEEAAGITDPNKQGYVSARLASGIGDMLHALFNRGALEWRNGVVSTKEGTIGLMEAFGMLPEGKLNDWLAWMAGNRAEQLAKRGKENNLTAEDIANLKAKAVGNEAVFEQVRQEYNKINKATLELAREAGLLNSEQIASFDTDWYVPFFRQDSTSEVSDLMAQVNSVYTKKTGIVGQSAQIKELLGGKSSTKDLLTNIIQRQVSLIDAAIKNNAAREVAANLDGTEFMTKASDAEASGEFTRQELASRQKVRVMEHGKPVHYLVSDPALLRGLMQVHDIGSKAIFNRMARSAKRFLTTGVTLSPDFIIRNFIRDAAHAWMVNKDGAKLGTDTWTGLKSSWGQTPEYWNLIAGGAAFQGGYIHGADPEAAQQQIRRHLREKGFSKSQIDNHMSSLVTTKDGLIKAFEKYRQVSDRLENSNRMTVYNRAKAAGKSERQALFEAKDLMDYSMKGNFQLMSTFIDMLPFFNARIQGLYKLGRASAADGNDQIFKALSKDLAFKGIKVAGFSLALAALNGDDERYKELPEWDKDAHWHFFMGDQHWRIPKPFELGIIFGTIPERMFNFAAGNQTSKDARESVGHAVWNTLALNPTPQLFMPVVELMMNRSMFTGAPIESLADSRREAVDRYGENTSDTARLIGQLTGLMGLSPKQVEHLITGYTGTLGAYTLGASDVLARLMTGRTKASTPIADYPVVRTIYQGGKTQRNTMYQQRFIESLNAARGAYGSYQLAIDEHDTERARKLFETRSNELSSRRQLERIQRQVSDLNSQMRVVQRDPSLSRKQKRERLDQLQLRRNQIYQNAYLTLNLEDW
ncbi:LPD38 domain-containing protein [Aliidiomarina maris]|uniref:Large polyvalent protein-associated domain-containing protein n=1 Tax=Aliidiomarina maris TaxID=531312 RepID=A0A327X3R9_9GAMM|nr:LPD38 domain-containing protein [Aliidiomarina maris]RAK01597.1 hypothetical protein B0I24_101220 [Aliidiomarina maris]RUO28423.1 hypothetical protein CWE07_01050 [Aliidiomarina maris]